MNEKFSLEFDLSNPKTPAILRAIADALQGVSGTVVVAQRTTSDEQTPPAEEKPARKRRTRKKTTAAPEQTPPAETEQPAAPAPAETEQPAAKYDIDALRALVIDKAKPHRKAIKAKLTEFGAAKLPVLDPKHYDDFGDFLNALD